MGEPAKRLDAKEKYLDLEDDKTKGFWGQSIAYGLPASVYLPLLAIILLATFTGKLPDNMVGGTAFLLLVAGALVYIGDRLPIWKDWLGGGLIFALISGAFISYFNIIPQGSFDTIVGFYYKPTNMLVWCIAALIAGSILTMPRTYLIKALPLYIPAVFGGLIFSSLFAYFGGTITGYGGIKAILTVVMPIEGGGLGAGAIPMSEIYAQATGLEFDQIFSMLIPAVVLGNIVAIVIGSVLNKVGDIKPSWTGNGILMAEDRWMPEGGIKEIKLKLSNESIVQGWVVAVSLLVIGYMLKDFIPIHYYALMIITTTLIKMFNILPNKVEQSAGHFYKFVASGFYGPLLLGIGMYHFKLDILVQTVTPTYLLLAFLVVTGAGLGAGIVGKVFFNLYPIESALTGGLCMANMGGSGDIAVLAGAHRMELMPFAQVSSRIGGAIMLLFGQLAISIWAQYLM